MAKKIPLEKLSKLAYKVLEMYHNRSEMINMMHQLGTNRHQCMVLELVLLGKDYGSIAHILLFTEDSMLTLVDGLYKNLKDHKKKVKLHNKLVGK